MPDVSKRTFIFINVRRLTSATLFFRSCQGEHEDGLSARRKERSGAGRDGRARGEDIVDEQDALAFYEARSLDVKSLADAFAPRHGIHPGAVTLSGKPPHEAPFV